MMLDATWTVINPTPGATYTVKGTGPMAGANQINFPPTVGTFTAATNTLSISGVVATAPFQANIVRFFNTFNIAWQISVNGGPYMAAGTSDNPVYVCLAGPGITVAGLPIPFRTTCQLACSNEGATNADQAVLNTWALLSGPSNLKGWDEPSQTWSRALYYYRPGTNFGANGVGSAQALLTNANSTGQCSTWADLFYDAIRLNGASAMYTTVTANAPTQVFLVRDWVPNAWVGITTFTFNNAGADMVPVPVPNPAVYGGFTNQNTLLGQNTAPSAPSEKVFGNHQFIQYTPARAASASSGSGSLGSAIYYDASYGVTYLNALDFQQKAVGGLGTNGRLVLGDWTQDVTQTPAALSVTFALAAMGY